ncbi:32107_t:CDS:2, partial [Gigaspora margarita]
MKRQKNSYLVEEKQKAVELACQTSNTYAANYYSLDLTMLAPPVIIFKGKTWPVNPPPPLASSRNSKAMLVLDSFSAHITDQVKAIFRSRNTDLATSQTWYRWIANGSNGLTKGRVTNDLKRRNLKRANLSTVCHWVLNTWNDISEDIIVRAFKKYGISNCLLGSKDYLIYNDDEGDSDKFGEYEDKEEFDEDYKSEEGEFDEGNNDNSNEYNKWPEYFVVIEAIEFTDLLTSNGLFIGSSSKATRVARIWIYQRDTPPLFKTPSSSPLLPASPPL